MKTRNTFLHLYSHSLTMTLLAGCLLLSFVAQAQENDKPSDAQGSTGPIFRGQHVKKLNLVIKNGTFTNAAGQKQEATIENIAEFAREKFHENIVLTPGAGNVVIEDLRLESTDMDGFWKALSIASGMSINTAKMGGENGVWAVTSRDHSTRRVEVFNISGYIQSGYNQPGSVNEKKLKDLQSIIVKTLEQAKSGHLPAGEIGFQFHEGANLFVVVGSDDAVDVSRKVIGALMGGQAVIGQPNMPQQPRPSGNRPQREAHSNGPPPGPDAAPGEPKQ